MRAPAKQRPSQNVPSRHRHRKLECLLYPANAIDADAEKDRGHKVSGANPPSSTGQSGFLRSFARRKSQDIQHQVLEAARRGRRQSS